MTFKKYNDRMQGQGCHTVIGYCMLTSVEGPHPLLPDHLDEAVSGTTVGEGGLHHL